MGGSLYFLEALKYLPHILTLVDVVPVSPTYGCFDRSFWHYKTADFPSGMYQENVLALALAYLTDFSVNPYFKNPLIKKLSIAGMRFAVKSSHADGSCDDYYPNEKALGATVFSLLAMTEAYQILGLKDENLEEFFKKRAEWLIDHNETGKLSNHQALLALSLYNVFLISGNRRFLEGCKERLKLLMSWQSSEGWFQEYEGADPGYQSVTIDALARYWLKSNDSNVLPAIKKALDFAVYFLHPDGSFGGEYGSRNTFIAYPAGMEILSKAFPEAACLASGFRKGIKNSTRAFLDDDRMVGHLIGNYLLACKYFQPVKKQQFKLKGEFTKLFPGCKLLALKNETFYGVVALNKGGCCKIFKNDTLCFNNTGPVVSLKDGRIGVTNHIMDCEYKLLDTSILVRGNFAEISREYMTPLKQILFRLTTLTVGRSFRGTQFIRNLMQKKLILGKKLLPISYEREIDFQKQKVTVKDKIWNKGSIKISMLMESSNLTSIYVAQSNAYQRSRLSEWKTYEKEKEMLNKDGGVQINMKIQ